MTDSSLPKKRKKVTLKASERGIVKAENALTRLGFESKSNFAASQLISRSTVTKFFHGEKIQLDSLKRICTALKLSWQEIAGMSESEELERSFLLSRNISVANEEKQKIPTSRNVTVVDPVSKKIKVEITLKGDVDSVDNWKIFQTILRQHSGSSINIIDIQSGSIQLTVEGSQEDIQKLVDKIKSLELTELNALPVEDIIEILAEKSEIKKSSLVNDKWHLVQEIVNFPLYGRTMSDADLSDTDLSYSNLSGAKLFNVDLSDANLSDANMIGANLSVANMTGANLNYTNLSYTNLSYTNLSYTDLRSANLFNASLRNANLRNANLRNANLSYTDMRSADLSNVALGGANLRSANLIGASLIDASLIRADVENTRFGGNQGISESMKLDLQKRGAIFEDYPGDRSETYALR